mgnify:CR=1 FL=1
MNTIGLEPLEDIARDRDAAAYSLRITSGTMGSEPILFARRRAMPGESPWESYFYRGMQAPVIFAGNFSLRLRFVAGLLLDCVPEDRRILVLGSEDLNPELDSLLGAFKPDCFYGTPTFMAKALEHVHDPEVRSGVRLVNMYGEFFTPELEALFRSALPRAEFTSGYASAEGGLMSDHACGYLPRATYHPRREVRVEVWEPDADGVGELMVTSTWSPSVRIEQYLTGDLGRIVPGTCQCGRAETFAVLGRKEADVVKFMGTTLRREEFERVAKELEAYVLDYRATAREYLEDGRLAGEVRLDVVPTPQLSVLPDPEQFLASAFAERLYVTPTRTLADLVREGILPPLEVHLVTSFPPEAKTVKLKKLHAR